MKNGPFIRVLVVEDHALTRMGLETVLMQDPVIQLVGTATTGLQALQQVEAEQPHVVLMDIGLPDMDGVDTTRQLKANWPDIRVLMLTSRDEEDDVFKALGVGADGYCIKGSNPHLLGLAIQTVHKGECWLCPGIARLILQRVRGMAFSFSGYRPKGWYNGFHASRFSPLPGGKDGIVA